MTRLLVPVTDKDHVQGSLTSPLTLVEYGDYQCPYCGMAYPVVKQVQKALGNQLCFVFRNFPLREAHPFAMLGAQAAEDASLQNKFWQMHDLLFENQASLGPDLIIELATDLKLDLKKFKNDMSSEKIIKRIEEDFMKGVRSGVNGTPCFFINGTRYEGEPSFEGLMKILSKTA
jgi:protein-disulfide isomerase